MHKVSAAIVFSFLVFLSFGATTVNAQSLKFELVNPGSSINVNDTFQVRILINTAGVETINADALINFDDSLVNIQNAEQAQPPFFTYFSDTPLSGTTSQYLISSWEESVAHAKSSTTDTPLATLNLAAKQVGTATLTFECTPGSEADSNINRSSDSEDILTNCAALSPLSVTIGGSGAPTEPTNTPVPTSGESYPVAPAPTATPTAAPLPTATPTVTPIPTVTPTPTIASIPRAGNVGITAAALSLGAILTMMGVLFML